MSAVCVVGLGKLGAVLAAVLASRGHQVIGLDVSPYVLEKINQGVPPIQETGLMELMSKHRSNLRATPSANEAVKKSEIAFVLVPTPTDDTGGFDNRYVLEAVQSLGYALRERTDFYTVVICSTVMPGSCAGPIKQALEAASHREVGVDLGLCYSPEFIALGSVIHDMTHPDMVMLGADDSVSRVALYDVLDTIVDTPARYFNLSLVDAEIAKISVNTFVTMKISFANTLGEICMRVPGADAHYVSRAIGSDSRIGAKYLKPGAAYGGPCFPRDTDAFAALAESVFVGAELAHATATVNRRQVLAVADALAGDNRVSVLGVAYKPDTGVTERSFGRELIELLQFEGILVSSYDPRNSEPINGNHVCSSAQECVNESDVVVIATPYPVFADLDFDGKTVIDMWAIVPDYVKCEHLVTFGVAP